MSGGASSRDVMLLAGSTLFVVVVSAAAALLEPAATPPGTGSTYSAGPRGAKAAFLALKRLGYRVERSYEPLADLTVDPGGTILVVASPAGPTSEADRKAVQRFLDAGGTLLATGAVGSLLPNLKTATLRAALDEFAPREATTFHAARHDALTDGVHWISMTPDATAFSVGEPYLALFGEGPTTAVLSATIGAGRAIWWSGSDPLVNASIAKPGHVELLLNALGPAGARRVIWSEYYHGHGRSFWSYLAGTPAPVALAQCALVALVALATFGRRQGPVRSVASESRTSVLEFVEALAGLYRKAGATAGAVEISLARARRVLSSATGLPAGCTDERIAAASAGRLGLDQDQVHATLRESAEAVGRDDLPPRTALSLVRRLQVIAAKASAITTSPTVGRIARR